MATKALTGRFQFGNNADMEAVSQLLKNYRQAQQPPLTRSQAAAKVEVSRATWFRWESGTRKIDEGKLPKVVEVTGIPAKELRPDLTNLLAVGAAE